MATQQPTESLTSVIRWRAVLLGFAVSLGLRRALGVASASIVEGNLGAQAALLFLALFAGGLSAGYYAGRFGVIQGVAVAVIFILIGASMKAWAEIDLATRFGPHVLGPMDMGGLILGDLVHLTGAFCGGWLADTLIARRQRAAGAPE
jgi:predicted Na+-dependent transporter